MAHITSFKIDGLLGRSTPIEFVLNRSVNIFFGENGSGKTTLLKILDAALSRDGDSMQLLPVQRAEVTIFSILENKEIKHTWERKDSKISAGQEKELNEFMLENELSSPDMRAQLRLSMKASTDWRLTPTPKKLSTPNGRWAHLFLPTTRLYSGDIRNVSGAGAKGPMSERQLDQAFAESINRSWLQFYSSTLIEVRQIQEQGLRTVLRQVLSPEAENDSVSPLASDAIYERVQRFLGRQSTADSISLGTKKEFKLRYQKESSLRRIIDNLDNVEGNIEKAMVPIDRFTSTISSLFSRDKKITSAHNELRIQLEDGSPIALSNLSSGEKHLVKILLTAITSSSNSLLIDEPELSMHIDWQRIFVRTLQTLNPSCQLLLASHSPEIMAEVPDECIFKI